MPLELAEPTSTITGLEAYENIESLLMPSDLILWLASVSPIWGNVRLQKESFLLWQEYQSISIDPGFYPDRFGPFSKMIADSIPILKARGRLEELPGRKYCITKLGRDYIVPKLQSLNASTEQIADKKIRWDEWKTHGITTYVYRLYPEYTTRTEVPHLKW